jgi:subtilisin family serine protease
MDPALWELLRRREGADEVEAILRLSGPSVEVPGARIVSRFGAVATCRIPADQVVAVRSLPEVYSVKAPRAIGPTLLEATSRARSLRVTERRRPPGLGATGAGTVVASVDWGVDVAAACFRWPVEEDGVTVPGGTRLLAMWDQREQHDRPPPQPYGYGVVHSRAEIDRALQTDDPYTELGYHPCIADGGSGTHGAHVLDIAAGNGLAGGPVGIAPEADLVFVHLADRDTGGTSNLGDSLRLLEAVDFIRRVAAGRPWVVNLSVGRTGGPHDATTLVEMGFEGLLATSTGCQIVHSAGNYRSGRTHTSGVVSAGGTSSFTFFVSPGDRTPNELEIWYRGTDELAVRIDPPGSVGAPALELGRRAELTVGDRLVGRVYHRRRDPNNGDNLVDAFLDPHGLAGLWTVTLEGRRVVDGRYDAWLERDDSCRECQARFVRRDAVAATTTGTIANGHTPLVVGAYDAHDPGWPLAPFSSWGPTRDGRCKPDLCAPGRDVVAVRSTPAGATEHDGALVRKSGTSMAAPHVTGAVALCLELLGPSASPRLVRELVLGTCLPTENPSCEHFGHGYLDIAALVAASRHLIARRAS